jgi:hypothetical protein
MDHVQTGGPCVSRFMHEPHPTSRMTTAISG